ncbi:MAG: hypothetical protein MR821_09515 [Clostridiales bacterium]|nr:hypothetical protein [Clostridiales bacterium]
MGDEIPHRTQSQSDFEKSSQGAKRYLTGALQSKDLDAEWYQTMKKLVSRRCKAPESGKTSMEENRL